MEQEPGAPSTHLTFSDDFDSACSTPFVSAPSSPGRGPPSGFFYSAPASPIHFMLSSSSNISSSSIGLEVSTGGGGFEFEFTSKEPAVKGAVAVGSMTSADELFLNGQIRPMKLSSHLQRPQILSPLIDGEEYETVDNNNNNSNNNIRESENVGSRGRDMKYSDRSKSLRRRARSMSPLRTNDESFEWMEDFVAAAEVIKDEKLEPEGKCEVKVKNEDNEIPASGASSRSSSVGRSSKRWVFLKEFLYRSKSEGRSSTSGGTSSNHKFWTSLSFSPSGKNDKKSQDTIRSTKTSTTSTAAASTAVSGDGEGGKQGARKAVNGVGMTGKRRMARSAHERHYTMNRAQAEELRRKTYLPYKQGLLGCLGFSSRSYGAMNGFARALNPVSSR